MISPIEQRLSRKLRAVLAGLPIGADIATSEQFPSILSELESFIPVTVGEIHPEVVGRSLDGIEDATARKTDENTLEVFGLAWFIADQTLTPTHVHLQAAATIDEIVWAEVRLGEHGRGREVIRHPSRRLRSELNRLRIVTPREILWDYEVTFGERQSSSVADGQLPG